MKFICLFCEDPFEIKQASRAIACSKPECQEKKRARHLKIMRERAAEHRERKRGTKEERPPELKLRKCQTCGKPKAIEPNRTCDDCYARNSKYDDAAIGW